jgi:hypothetical protein
MRRHVLAVGLGAMISVLMLLFTLGARPDLSAALWLPKFWTKFLFALAVAGMALLATTRLSQPGARLAGLPVALILPFLAIWLVALYALGEADPGQRISLILGSTWAKCPWLIALLSAPVFAGSFWAMRGLAPTRPVLSGAAAGLLSGAVATLVYCLHCPEMEAPFVAIWYVLGMLIPTAIGALAGPALLRW